MYSLGNWQASLIVRRNDAFKLHVESRLAVSGKLCRRSPFPSSCTRGTFKFQEENQHRLAANVISYPYPRAFVHALHVSSSSASSCCFSSFPFTSYSFCSFPQPYTVVAIQHREKERAKEKRLDPSPAYGNETRGISLDLNNNRDECDEKENLPRTSNGT